MKRSTLHWLAIGLFVLSALMFWVTWIEQSQAEVIVKWETASELETAGFNVYRGLSPDVISQRLNANLILPAVDPLQGGVYEYRDPQVEPGRTYYYQIEEVEIGGQTNQYGPIEVHATGGGLIALAAAVCLAFGGVTCLVAGRRKALFQERLD
ncbi:MAG: hypothetical protein MUE67_04140 [Anaerolineales bacterium]|nr:hypothetical protein [Anaerolineales bacterium]